MHWRDLLDLLSSALDNVTRLKTQDEIPDVNFVTLAHRRCLRDLSAVHIRAVGALQIGHDEATVTKQKASVVFRNVALREHQIIALNPSDADLVLVIEFAALGSALLTDDHREHVVPSQRTPAPPTLNRQWPLVCAI